jgi:hypothetical protein
VIEEEFIFFKGVKIEEIFGREKDSLLRIKGWHVDISSFVKVGVLEGRMIDIHYTRVEGGGENGGLPIF